MRCSFGVPHKYIAIALLPLLAACSRESADNAVDLTAHGHQISIHRDQYGTPHIFADDNYGVYFGYGYAVAEDRLFQQEMLKRTTQGRVAEALGEKYLPLDRHIRTAYDHRAVKAQLTGLAPGDREILRAYADGFNRRIDEVLANQPELPLEFVSYDFLPERWTDYDVAMLFAGAIAHRYSDFNSELDNLQLIRHLEERHDKDTAWQIFNASKWLLDKDSPTTVPRERNQVAMTAIPPPPYLATMAAAPATRRVAVTTSGEFVGTTEDPAIAQAFNDAIRTQGFGFSPEFAPASNFWSVGKDKAAGANGILVNGPQFGFSIPSYVYGVGLHGGDFNVVGNTLLGLPTLLFAHNNHVAWGSTAGLSDQVDVFVETLDPDNPEQYLHNGVYKPFERWAETIQVRDSEPVIAIARRSLHGMVQQRDLDNGVAYSRARSWEGGELASLMAWVNLAKDRTLDQVQQRIGDVATNINFYYMDTAGNQGYTHGGRYPLRKPDQDSRLPTPGTGEWDWRGYRPYSENPTVRNPTRGYIANWNNRPEGGWEASDLWTYTWSRADRAAFIFSELEARKTLTIADVWAVNRSVSFDDVTAPFLLPYLYDAWREQAPTEELQSALGLLEAWDGEWRVDDHGNYGAAPLLMETWLKHLLETVFRDDIGAAFFHLYAATNNPTGPLGPSMVTAPGVKALIRLLDQISGGHRPTYDFCNGKNHNAVLRDTFSDAVASLTEQYGEDRTQWMIEAHPMQWKPYNFRGVPQALEHNVLTLPGYMNRGSENNLFIADDGGFTAFDVIPPGQSGNVNAQGQRSPHYSDQLRMYGEFRYKPVPFSREEVMEISVSSRILKLSR